jgi:hypothetical protein
MSPSKPARSLPRPHARTGCGFLRPFLLALALLVAGSGGAAAQEGQRLSVSDTLWQVRLADGETYVGRVVEIAGDTVTLRTATGTRIQFTRRQAVRVRAARGQLRQGSFWAEDPNTTRLFFSPTARTLPRGGGYFGVYELVIPFVAYGVTDWLLVAGGSPFYLAFNDEFGYPPLYFGPKIRLLQTDRLAASLGSLTVLLPEEGDDDIFSIVYGVGTWGSTDHALSFGAGWGYVEDDFSEKPLVMVGGETRVGRMTKLMTENLFVPGEDGVILSGGIRFFGERLSADAGLAGWLADDSECCFPLVNFVYNFGGGQ